MSDVCDLLVVGGGINGAGIARDAAGRGLSVRLVEQHDLASHTSSASSKLIHGGLRYLEHREFGLVREALAERERLLAIAPHLVSPLRFVLPYAPGMRPRWLLRLGLFVYDHLHARQKLAESRELDLTQDPAGQALRPELTRGFEYWDCAVDDARLVVMNALDAAERGASVHVRTRLLGARVVDGLWQAECVGEDGHALDIRARALVNASGAWVNDVLAGLGVPARRGLQLVRGSHLVFPRLYEGSHACLLQNTDRRVVFLIPFGERWTLVGTTDAPHCGDPGQVDVTPAEARYLVDCANRFLRRPVRVEDAVTGFAGVRALCDEDASGPAQQLSRDYVLELQHDAGAPVLSVYGGKITTYRRLAEQALARLLPALGRDPGGDWTDRTPLPGGDLPPRGVPALVERLRDSAAGIDAALLARLAQRYGTRATRVLAGARTQAELGEDFGQGLTAREVDYLRAHEWARTPADVLRRRTWLWLAGDAALESRLAAYFSTKARSIT